MGWDVSAAVSDVASFSVASEASSPLGLAFSDDGTKMYIADDVTNTVYQYTLATPWSITTASYSGVSFSVAAQNPTPVSVTFANNGLAMYTQRAGNNVVQYTLSVAWDLSTAVYSGNLFNVSGQDSSPESVQLKTDGTKMYMVGLINRRVYQYSLGTPFNVASAVYDSVFLATGAQDTAPLGLFFKPSGFKFYVTATSNNRVFQYELSTAWDLSTAVYSGKSFLTSAQTTGPQESAFRVDTGEKLFVLGSDANRVYQYTVAGVDDEGGWLVGAVGFGHL